MNGNYKRYILGEWVVSDEQKIREIERTYSKSDLANMFFNSIKDLEDLKQQLSLLQQEKEELIKWLEEEKENNLEKYKFWKEKKNYSMMGDYDTKTEILAKVLSKIKESEK